MTRIVLGAVAVALSAATLAYAATPKGGATYSGKITEGLGEGSIKLKVYSSAKAMDVVFNCADSPFKLKGVEIKASGRFVGSYSITEKGENTGESASIEGRFTSARRAKGELLTRFCFYTPGVPFSAAR